MPNMEQQFRTAAFGGYQKQDVLNYIDATSKEQRGREESLRKELEVEKKARTALEKERGELAARVAALDDNLEAVAATLEETRAELGNCARELEEKDHLLDERVAECAALHERLAKAEPAAKAYEAVKDRTAGLELEAHHRAREAEEAARRRAEETQAEVEAWLTRLRARYDDLRTDMAATGAHAAGELTRLAGMAEQLSAAFDIGDEEMERFARLCQEGDGPQPPEPLPLDGE